MLVKVHMAMESANRAIADGSLPKTIQAILEEQKPEAAYFVADKGLRTGYLIVNIAHESDIPRIAEPWFLSFNATIEATPAMTVQDLQAAGPSIEAAARKYGARARGTGAD
jgi:hypothetical protein